MSRVLDLLGKDGPVARTLRVTSTPVTTLEALWVLLLDAPIQGWVCLTDEVLAFDHGEELAAKRGSPLLSAELLRTDGSALHIRQHGEGWLAVLFHEGEGEDVLAFDNQTLISSRPGADWTLQYRVYWRRRPGTEDVRPWEPWTAAFAGWHHEAGETP